jgi:hypothetical protein
MITSTRSLTVALGEISREPAGQPNTHGHHCGRTGQNIRYGYQAVNARPLKTAGQQKWNRSAAPGVARQGGRGMAANCCRKACS